MSESFKDALLIYHWDAMYLTLNAVEECWDHQQKKVSELLISKSKMREEYRALDGLCESYRKEIKGLEGKLKSYENTGMIGSSPAQFMDKIKTLTAQIELLTKCECFNEEIRLTHNLGKCRPCKNKQAIGNMEKESE